MRRLLERGRARPLAVAAGAGAGLSVVLVVAGLPFSIAAEQRARDFGLSTQDWGSWTVDVLKGALISVPLTALGTALLSRSSAASRVPGSRSRRSPSWC